MSSENLCIEKEIFYHVDRVNQWKVNETKFIGGEKNKFVQYFDITNYTIGNPKNNTYYSINDIARDMIKYSENKQKPAYLEEFYHFNINETLKEVNLTQDNYLLLTRELIFEEVRKEFFPNLPSRQRCMWVIPNNMDALKYWWNILGKKGQIFKMELTGKIHRANQQYLNLNTNSIDYLRMEAFKYWSATKGINDIEEECLFEGFATTIEVLDPITLGI